MTTAREDTTRLADLLRREHHAMAEFLIALSTFDRDRRWEELGYPSLFDFLRRELKLSAGAAQYRKTAAELVRRYPEVEAALRRGDLCLSSVAQLAKVLTAENAAEVLPLFFGKSSRDAEFVAASLRPAENPPRRDFIVTPVRANPNFGPGGGVTRSAFRAREMPVGAGATVEPAALAAAFAAPPPATTPELPSLSPSLAASASLSPPLAASASLSPRVERLRIRPLDAERARVNMTVSRRLLEKLAAARDVLSHSHPGASEETILELGLDLIIDRHRKRRGIGAKPRTATMRTPTATPFASASATPTATAISAETAAPAPTPASISAATSTPVSTATATATATATLTATLTATATASSTSNSAAMLPAPPPPPSHRSRHVPVEVWREVWARDGGRCAWPLADGGVCGSTYRLQLDHVDGWARGADTSVDGCRLLCQAHNLRHARALYGDALIDRHATAKARKGPACSEPVACYGSGGTAGEEVLKEGGLAVSARLRARVLDVCVFRAPAPRRGGRMSRGSGRPFTTRPADARSPLLRGARGRVRRAPPPPIAPPSQSHAGASPLAPAATSRRVNTETAWQPAVWRARSVRARAGG